MHHKYGPVEVDERSETERTSLSNDESEDKGIIYNEPWPPRKGEKNITLIFHAILLFFNLLLVVGAFIFLRRQISPSTYSRFEYAPLKDIIKYKAEYWNLTLGDESEYTHSPSDEVDAAWDRITAPPGKVGFVMATQKEMKHMNITSVAAKDGSGYLVTIDVFHQLHCLDFLRRTIYNDSYYHMDPNTHSLHGKHVGLSAHCIDSIRLSLQCHADTSVIPFTWLPNYKLPWPDFRSTHKCRNFDDILAFAQENFFDAEKHKDLFVHPELGEYTGGATGDPTEQGKQGSAAWEPREGESS